MSKQKYYKVLTKDLMAPNNTDFSYKGWENKTFKVKGKIELYDNGLHLYTSLKNISTGNFGPRVFEAKIIGNEYIDNIDKVCCKEIKLIKEIDINKVKDNCWIYHYCRNIKDKKELWSKLTDNGWICNYCNGIKDRKELWSKLTDNMWIYHYCINIKNRKELRDKIK